MSFGKAKESGASWKVVSGLVLPLASAFGVLSGCGKKHGSWPSSELVAAIFGEPEEGYDPTTGWGRYGSPLFQSALLARDNDLNIVNDLATACEVSPDGLIYTVRIRRDVKFSDGKPLTAKDAAYTSLDGGQERGGSGPHGAGRGAGR